MPEFIAETELTYRQDGVNRRVSIKIGCPYCLEAGEYACQLEISGVINIAHPIFGQDSFQALDLALQLLKRLIADYERRYGGRFISFYDETDQSYVFDESPAYEWWKPEKKID